MRKFFPAVALLSLSALPQAQAGGYLTNTNQSVAFLRNPARDAFTTIDAAYSNPAGLGFMAPGWHFAFDLQSAYQTRTIESTFGDYFTLGTVNGVKNGSATRKYDGKAKAPVIPSFDLARVGDHWFASFHFGITGGGGKCNFGDGLGSFESQVALLPALMSVVAPGQVTGYSINTHMQGRQYYYGGQFGVGYKITPRLNVSVGGRVVYADCNYYGYVKDISVVTAAGATVPADQFLTAAGLPDFTALVANRELNCDQSGWGFTPIVSVNYQVGRVNLAARYEFKTRLRLKNKSGLNTSGLSEYDDGKKVAADIPAILSLGAKWDATEKLRLSTGFHYYFDKQATQYEDRQEHLKGGGWEVLAGAEYDIAPRWTISAGWQTTHYGLGDDSRFLSDMSFVTNSNSVGIGARFQLKKKVALNLAYFKTFYRHYDKHMDDYDGIKGKFEAMVGPLGQQLKAGQAQVSQALQNPQLTPEMRGAYEAKLQQLNTELAAAQGIATALPQMNTAGTDRFSRTNDVFGIGLEIDF